MKYLIRIGLLLVFQILCFSMIELKDTGLFGSMSFVIIYCLFNLLSAAGIFSYGFFSESFAKLFAKRTLRLFFCLVFFLSGILTLLSTNLTVYLLSLFISSLFSGIIGGAAYFSIHALVSKWRRGRVIGAGLALGTLIHYFVELSRLLANGTSFIFIYTAVFFVAAAAIFMLLPCSCQNNKNIDNKNESSVVGQKSFIKHFLILIAATAIICYLSSLYEGIITMSVSGEQSAFEIIIMRNTKLLYCASVIAAGFIADLKGRQYISLIATAVMTLLIFNVFLLNYPIFKFLNWIILFAGSGFLSMFVTLNFIDIAGQTKRPTLWAGGGRIIKHAVTAFGPIVGALLWHDPQSGYIIIILQYLVLLTALIFLLFWHYRHISESLNINILLPVPDGVTLPDEEQTSPIPQQSFGSGLSPEIAKYGFTDKEKQVLLFILTGTQIKDIAKELYITERTVKFHITNILEKTGHKNQRELISSFANSYFFRL